MRVRWGILSTAKIGTEKVITAMQSGEHCEIIAIASRKLDTAQAAARRLGIPSAVSDNMIGFVIQYAPWENQYMCEH